jgi:hypothetical protein
MHDGETLWRRIHPSFEYHREATDCDAQTAMDRIASKCIRSSTRKSFNPSNCSVREDSLPASSLQNLKLYHSRANPYHLNGPIIILLYDQERVVIEGNNRVNAWLARQTKGPFSVITVEPHQEST